MEVSNQNYYKMYAEIEALGYPSRDAFSDQTDYMNAIGPPPKEVLEIVFKWIPFVEHKAGIASFVRKTKEPYDGRILVPIFNEADSSGKWSLCSAIEANPPLNINEWVKNTYLDKRYGYRETGLLPLAVAKMFPRDEAREILKEGFDQHYHVTPTAFGKVGRLEDIPFLESKLARAYKEAFVRKDIVNAISRIKKREKKA